MFIFVKLIISAIVVTVVSELAKKYPSMGGLIAAMPLTTLLTLFWINLETSDPAIIQKFLISVLWGIIPTIFFFIAAIYLFKKEVGFYSTVGISLVVLMAAVAIHRMLLPDA